MSNIRSYNQSEPFWDFIASLEDNDINNHPFIRAWQDWAGNNNDNNNTGASANANSNANANTSANANAEPAATTDTKGTKKAKHDAAATSDDSDDSASDTEHTVSGDEAEGDHQRGDPFTHWNPMAYADFQFGRHGRGGPHGRGRGGFGGGRGGWGGWGGPRGFGIWEGGPHAHGHHERHGGRRGGPGHHGRERPGPPPPPGPPMDMDMDRDMSMPAPPPGPGMMPPPPPGPGMPPPPPGFGEHAPPPPPPAMDSDDERGGRSGCPRRRRRSHSRHRSQSRERKHAQGHGHGHGGPQRGGWGGRGRGRFEGRGGGRHGHGNNNNNGPFNMSHLSDFIQNQIFGPYASQARNMTTDSTGAAAPNGDFTPPADIFDTPTEYIVDISLPGAKKPDIAVAWDAERSELNVTGVVHRSGDEAFLAQLALGERSVGAFARKVRLGSRASPAAVDAEGITAKLEEGVLRVVVPKEEREFEVVHRVEVD